MALSFANAARKYARHAHPVRCFLKASHAVKKSAAASSSLRPTMLTTASVCTGWTMYTAAEAHAASGDPIKPRTIRNTSQPFKACRKRFVRRNPGAQAFQREYSTEKEKIVSGR